MIKLSGIEEKNSLIYLDLASKVAQVSQCLRKKCGAIILKKNVIIGEGFNSQPQNKKSDYCRKTNELLKIQNFKSDKTCCIHAEQRAILDAMFNKELFNFEEDSIQDCFKNSIIYFTFIDGKEKRIPSGKPYCTICSKLALDVGIEKWCLWHDKSVYGEEGVYLYDSFEYNELSFENNKNLERNV